MTTVLRPMSTGEVLDRTFSLYRNNFVLFFGISTLPPALWLLMQVVMYGAGKVNGVASEAGRTVAIIAAVVGVLLGVLAYFVGLAIAQAATIFAVSAVHLDRPTTIRASYQRVRGRYGRVFNVVLSVALRVFGAGIVLLFAALMGFALIPALNLSMGLPGIIIGALAGTAILILAMVIFCLLLVRYSLAVPACVLEDIKARQAIKRSVWLSKGCRGRIFVVYILFAALQTAVTFALFFVLGLTLAWLSRNPVVTTVATDAAYFLVGALLGPIITIAMSLVYYDERVRKEAFDIQLMMASIDGTPPPAKATGAPAGVLG